MKTLMTALAVIVLLALNALVFYQAYEQRLDGDVQNKQMSGKLADLESNLSGLQTRLNELEREALLQKEDQLTMQDITNVQGEIVALKEATQSQQQEDAAAIAQLGDRIKLLEEKPEQPQDNSWQQELGKLKQEIDVLGLRFESIYKSPPSPSETAK